MQLNIQGTIIDFPDSATSPNWAPAVDQFAKAVEQALASVVGPFDVPPQALIIDAYNPGTNVNIAALSFPTSTVRSFTVNYAVFRTTTTAYAYETGQITAVYNPNGPTNNKWDTGQGLILGDGKISFNVTDTGQVQFSTTALAGSTHQGKLTFSAKAILQS